MKKYHVLLLFGLIGLFLSACGVSSTPTAAPTATAVAQNTPPQETATDDPANPTAVPPTPTPELAQTEADPTTKPLFPTPVVTATPTLTPTLEAPNYTITIIEPAPATTLLAGREATFRGEIQPPATAPLTLTLQIGSVTAVSAQIVPDAASGTWELIATVDDTASGPGLLTVALGALAQVNQPNPVVFDSAEEAPNISLTRPTEGETAVAGHAFLMQGSSSNLIDESFTIGILADGCTNFIAAQKISLTSGEWYGFVILPQTLEPGPACAVAYTGEYGAGDWRQAIIPIQLLPADDPQAALLQLGNPGELNFVVGEATTLFGVAINMPDNAVDIALVLDSNKGEGEMVASGKAFADQFGLWSIDLSLPEEAPGGSGLLTISSGEEETYQEIRLSVTITH